MPDDLLTRIQCWRRDRDSHDLSALNSNGIQLDEAEARPLNFSEMVLPIDCIFTRLIFQGIPGVETAISCDVLCVCGWQVKSLDLAAYRDTTQKTLF